MIRRGLLLLALGLVAQAGDATAETIRIRSGEHADFTRLVVTPDQPTEWSFGREGDTYVLRLARPEVRYDLGELFVYVPRVRLLDARGGDNADLTLAVSPDTHATAFNLATGLIVVDIKPGPADPASPFEKPLAMAQASASAAPAPVSGSAPVVSQRPAARPQDVAAAEAPTPVTRTVPAPTAMPGSTYLPEPRKDPHLSLYWQGPGSVPFGTPPAAASDPAETALPVAGAAPSSETPVATHQPEPSLPPSILPLPGRTQTDPRIVDAEQQLLRQLGRAATQGLIDVDPTKLRHAKPAPAVPHSESAAESVPQAAPAAETPAAHEAAPAPAHGETPAAQEPARTETASAEHAAAPDGAAHDAAVIADPATPAAGAESHMAPLAMAGTEDPLALLSETAIDRDSLFSIQGQPLTENGLECLPDSSFDLTSWLGEGSPSERIASLRTGLVGEFDTPEETPVVDLARLYVALGFGAEAEQLLVEMKVRPRKSDLLRDMARIMDGRPVRPDSPLLQMTDCDTAAALWSVLARPSLTASDTLNIPALLRSFSALPLDSRRLLGPQLADKLMSVGAEAAAYSVRGAITRATGEHGPAVQLMDAKFDLAAGEGHKAAEVLTPLIAENSPDSPQALILYVEAQMEAGKPVETKTVDSLAALAYEHRKAEDAQDLNRAYILAAGSAGQFDRALKAFEGWKKHADGREQLEVGRAMAGFLAEAAKTSGLDAAFAALGSWGPELPVDLRRAALRGTIRTMADLPDDAEFLRNAFARKDLISSASLDWPLRADLARRMLSLGFGPQAREMAGLEALDHEDGRIILGKAALAEHDPARALTEIAGIETPEAAAIRGEALALLGDHTGAKEAYAAAGDQAAAVAEAWRSGDWGTVAEQGTEAQRAALAGFDGNLPPADPAAPLEATAPTAAADAAAASDAAPADSPPGIAPPATLAQNRALIEESKAAREALQALLAQGTGQ
ncbi:hypothetical protein [Phaeovulum sp. W22_SRMD_FR3]|uniref:hypothetical protein n=1 Tax=Phaeovulum sp. W22_SRMD_FR3 TaxID=3240274 RepID=UPI003F9BF6E8